MMHVEEDRGYLTPCWIWTGGVNERGYGRAWGGQAHRVYFKRHGGIVPVGMELDHLCRVRRCVNPDHLEVVTHAENVARGSIARAAATQHDDPSGVRALRAELGLTQRALAERLGISQALVSLWELGKWQVTDTQRQALEAVRRELAEHR